MQRALTQLAFICLCCISIKSFSQYIITPIAPPPTFSFDDLWHFTVVRSITDDNAQFYVSLRVFDGADRLRIKSNTATVSLPPGSHYYNLSNISLLQPFTTSYHDAGILQQTINSGGNFPPGTYHLVYTLYGKAADGVFTPLAEDVSEALVETLWPPMLLSPADEEIIDTRYPILTWTPAFSSSYPGQISYTLKLVELYPGQNTYQAMAANPAYFTQNNIPVTMLPYPPSAQLLDTTRTYVWQVHADAQGTQMGSSEIWSFTYAGVEPPPVKKLPKYYFKPSVKLLPEFMSLTEAFLPIAFEERYYPSGTKSFGFNILNERKELLGTNKDFDAAIKTGFNQYLIPVCSSEGKISLPKGKYYIEILLEKKTKYYIAFQIKETHCHD
jgi:hypothetical protein